METTIEKWFLSSVYRTAGAVWTIGVGVSWIFGGSSVLAGWTAGSVLSVGVLRVIELAVKRFLSSITDKPRHFLAKLLLVELSIIVPAVVAIVLIGGHSLPFIVGVFAGLSLSQISIVFNALGLVLRRD
ncbi:MAG: hypothetical protein ACUVRS_03860 [Armatimonadota bacterium]